MLWGLRSLLGQVGKANVTFPGWLFEDPCAGMVSDPVQRVGWGGGALGD